MVALFAAMALLAARPASAAAADPKTELMFRFFIRTMSREELKAFIPPVELISEDGPTERWKAYRAEVRLRGRQIEVVCLERLLETRRPWLTVHELSSREIKAVRLDPGRLREPGIAVVSPDGQPALLDLSAWESARAFPSRLDPDAVMIPPARWAEGFDLAVGWALGLDPSERALLEAEGPLSKK